MKHTKKHLLDVAISLLLCFGLLFSINLPAQAADVEYVYAGRYIKNWGTREEVATFLSQNAIAFYKDNNTSYQELASLSGSSDINTVMSSELYTELQNLMASNHTKITSYQETRPLYQYTDCQNSGKTSNKISSFYSGVEIGPTWDAGKTWNREHTWPNSKGDGDGENDIMMLRPTATSENSSRSNIAYGESGGYYDPNQQSDGKHNLHGDVARIMVYQYVRWGQTRLWGTSGVIENRDVLLKWMREDPVDTWELGRNDAVESITGTRNVFVDYPELVFLLFGERVPGKYTSPSGEGLNTASSSGDNNISQTQSSASSTTPNDTQNSSSETVDNTCHHTKAYKISAEDPRCNLEGYTEGTYCPECKTYISGRTVVDATGHSYQGDCDATCDTCGAIREVTAEHMPDSKGNCSVCGASDLTIKNTDTIGSDSTNTPEKGGFKWWIVAVSVGGTLVVGVAVVLIIFRKKLWPTKTE